VSRVSPDKGPLETLSAFERVVAAGADARLVVVGDGPSVPDLKAAIKASPAGQFVYLKGMLDPESVAEEMSRAHVFLQHSRPAYGGVEGFGVSLTEGGAAGLPIVASDFGGIPDQIESGRNGFLHRPDDVEGQAACMTMLARDEALRLRMGAAAREMARRFDSALMAQRLEAEILTAIGKSRP
jgi:glycosyltransferase involved in cell wall biosynthesis